MRLARLLLLLSVCVGSSPASASPAAPAANSEVQLCAQSFRDGERARAEKALGSLDTLNFYKAQLTVDPETHQVTGFVAVQVTAREHGLSQVFLRVSPNAFGAGRVQLGGVSVEGTAQNVEHPQADLYKVRLKSQLSPGQSVTLTIPLHAHVPSVDEDEGLGIGMSKSTAGSNGAPSMTDHGAFGASSSMVSLVGLLPQVPPLDASGQPWAGPGGFGDIALYGPGNYLVSVSVPQGWRAVAPGAELGEVPATGGMVGFTYGICASRDFPIFVMRKDTVLKDSVGSVTVEAHVFGADVPSGRKMLAHAVGALRELERKLGPYPYATYRVVEAPLSGGAGGMEFPGLVTVASSLVRGLDNPLAALGVPKSISQMLQAEGAGDMFSGGMAPMLGRLLEFTVAHETAHQWFAGLVGSDPIKEPVVDETLAQYCALLYLEWHHGREAAEQMKAQQLVPAYQLYRVSGGPDGPAARPTTDFATAMEYGALVYGKAPLLHAAERHLLGDQVFYDGLRSYVDRYRYQWASEDSLSRVFADKAPAKRAALNALRRHWWNEAHGDEDLGSMDVSNVVQGMTGVQMDKETEALVKQLLPQLLGK